MVKDLRVAAFVGGGLHFLGERNGAKEIVLALPLSRVIAKVLKTPSGGDLQANVQESLKLLNPYPDEPLTVSCETMRETAEFTHSLAAALPESACDDIADALDEAKVNVKRIDILELGLLRKIWGDIKVDNGKDTRKIVIVDNDGYAGVIVLDGDSLSSIRAISFDSRLNRELMLSLLEAEDFGGEKTVSETIFLGESVPDCLQSFAPVRQLPAVGVELMLEGIAERAEEESSLDILPQSWREVLDETRFKAKLVKSLATAGGLWFFALSAVLGGPVVLGFMTDHQKELCRDHRPQFREVSQMRDRVKIVRKYSDHSQSALMVMKLVSDSLPESIELSSWDYTRNDGESTDGGIRIRGTAENRSDITLLKTRLESIEITDENQNSAPLFSEVALGSISTSKNGVQNFDIDCRYIAEDTAE